MSKSSTYNIAVKLNSAQFEKAAAKLGKNVINVGNTIKFTFARMISNSLQQAFGNMISIGRDFENQMARVKAVSNATRSQFAALEKEARRMGATTKFSASEAAESLEYLTRNGLSPDQATRILSSVMKFAGANAVSLSESANTLTNVLNMYGLSVDKATKVSDVMSTAAAKSATNVTELYEAFVNAGPSAASLGLSIEETTAALMTLANKGVKGADAGSKLAQAFSKILNPKIQKDLRELGINIDSNKIKSKGLISVLEELKSANLAPEQLVKIFGERSWRGINTLIESLDVLKTNMDYMNSSSGTTFRMFEEGIGSIEKSSKELKSIFEESVLKIFDRIKPAIHGSLEALKGLTSVFGNLGAVISLLAGNALRSFVSGWQKQNKVLNDNNLMIAKNKVLHQELSKVIITNKTSVDAAKNSIIALDAELKKQHLSTARTSKALKILAAAEKELDTTGKVSKATQKKLAAEIAVVGQAASLTAEKVTFFSGAVIKLKGAWTGLKAVGSKLWAFIGGWPGLLITVASLLGPIISKINQAKKELKNIANVDKEANDQVKDDIAQINKLHAILSNNNISLETRKKALNQLKSICKDYNGKLTEEGKLIDDNTDSLKNHKNALIADAKARILAGKAAELEMKLEDQEAEYAVKQAERDASKPNLWDNILSASASAGGSTYGGTSNTYVSPADIHASRMKSQGDKELAAIEETKKALEKVNEEMNIALENSLSNGNSILKGDTYNIENELNTREKIWAKYSKDIEWIQKQAASNSYDPINEYKNAATALKERISATESLISSIEGLDDRNDKDLESLKALRIELAKLQLAYEDYKEDIKETKYEIVDEIKVINEISKAAQDYQNTLARRGQKDNPWDNFTPRYKTFRQEKKTLADLENQLQDLQKVYDKFTDENLMKLKQVIDDNNDSTMVDSAKKALEYYEKLGKAIPALQGQINNVRIDLGEKQAGFEISNLKKDIFKGRYEEIKNTTNAVVSLTSSIQDLLDTDWNDLTPVEVFEKFSSLIFGTIDSILSVIETFRTVSQLLKDLQVAEETYAAAKLATAGATTTASAEETAATTAAMATQSAEVVAANAVMTKAYNVTAAAAATAANAAAGWAGVALAAGQIAAMQALVSGAAVLPTFSEGGIVKGKSSHGDQTLARLNNGEMVLNASQQQKLFNMLNKNNSNSSSSQKVEFILKGKDLSAALKNYQNSIKPTISTL